MLYTFEHGFPMLYHYRLIEMGSLSTGQSKFEKFQKALEDDMILDHVKRNLVVSILIELHVMILKALIMSFLIKGHCK